MSLPSPLRCSAFALACASALSALSTLLSCSVPEPRTAEPLLRRRVPAVEVARIQDPALVELSGLASSRRNPGIVWAHNDSGDTARLFAIDVNGVTVTQLKLDGAQAVDWEDMAIGPGPDGRSTLFVADTGDNFRARPEITIYRAIEPLVTPGDDMTATSESLDFTLPGGPRDIEALLRDPLSNRLYLVAKEAKGLSPIFSADALAPSGTKTEMEEVGSVKLGPVTAGDISFDGTRVALRTPTVVAEWIRDRNESIESALQRPPTRVLSVPDPNGEALAYSMDVSILLSSEGPKPPIQRIDALASTP
jgi:hypothetical protein